MKMYSGKSLWIMALTLFSLSGCGSSEEKQPEAAAEQWHVSGTIKNGDGRMLYVELSDNGMWTAVDSVKLPSGGAFDFSVARGAYPDIYRLRFGSDYIYFPVDSTETVTVTAENSDGSLIASTVSGNQSAQKMQQIDEAIKKFTNEQNGNRDSLKKEVIGIIGTDWDGMAAYYAINKKVGDAMLFDSNDKSDIKIIRAVTNMFQTNRPDDPRTKMLLDMTLSNIGPDLALYAESVPIIEVSLNDDKGVARSLTEIFNKSKVLIIDFNDYSQEIYPSYNIMLGEVYKKYKDRGLEIYQIGYNQSALDWAKTAVNLPWVTVFGGTDAGLRAVTSYNVVSLPTLFVIDSEGNNVVRLKQSGELEETVKSLLN